ncbi:hypothetical protein FSP39_016196 [Pinctada imbricata]|uniref:Uncharacterized protein n=1 Tax=Pinctada imbricata TaxID=66713 RepID=A0AA89C1M0_PINIB|nr:hypothetical protein FSP39_016196 [Pinctada imbricata]
MDVLSLYLVILTFLWGVIGVNPEETLSLVRVPGFFYKDDTDLLRAFQWTFTKLNVRTGYDICNVRIGGAECYVPSTSKIRFKDSFEVSKKVCQEVEAGSKVLFGPNIRSSSGIVNSIASSLSIPHIQFHWEPHDIATDTHGPRRIPMTINVYPHYLKLAEAHADLIRHWQWNKFTVIYQDNDSLIRLQKVLQLSSEKGMNVTIRKMDKNPNNHSKLLKEIGLRVETRIVVDCSINEIEHFLQTDLSLVNMEPFIDSGANITAFRIINPDSKLVTQNMADWRKQYIIDSQGTKTVSTKLAMLHDAVHLLDIATIHYIDKLGRLDYSTPLSCSKTDTWSQGTSFMNYLKTVVFYGMTGQVQFNNYGVRDNFTMEIITPIHHNGTIKIGEWHSLKLPNETGILITRSEEEIRNDTLEKLKHKTLRVVTKTDDPYVFNKERNPDGSIKYTGFAIDILDRVAESLNFSYEIYMDAPGYGNCASPSHCDGMVKELVNHSADLAVAGMTITYDREKYVDFTKPFLNLGITILIRKSDPEPPDLFSFLHPFNNDVWINMIAGFLFLSFLLFIIGRLTPFEWTHPGPCDPNTDNVQNQFSLLNSLWFCIGCLLQQGSDLSPGASSTRIVAICWWFFTMIMVSSYTANLAAFLTMKGLETSIKKIDDLPKQSDIKYGTLAKGSTNDFFRFSRDVSTTYQNVWNVMQGSPDVLVNNSKLGIQKVLNENYAFFAESTTIDYVVQRECKLTQVGGWLNSIGYGIALPEDSPYRDEISQEILRLREEQVIDKLYNYWWKEKDGGGNCIKEKDEDKGSLRFENVAGVFVVLLMGSVAGICFALLEFCWTSRKYAKKNQQSTCSEMKDRIQFIMPLIGSCNSKRRQRDNATMRQRDNATTRQCDNATMRQRDNATTRQCDNAIMRQRDNATKRGAWHKSATIG